MALDKLNKLSEEELENVVGGLSRTNAWGDGSLYKIGLSSSSYAYTFPTSRFAEYDAAVKSVSSVGLTKTQYERAKLEALKKVPGLLTAIDGCPEEWY